jgi:PKD repeat protein
MNRKHEIYRKIGLILMLMALFITPASAYNSLSEQTVNVDVNGLQGICNTPTYPMYINIRDVVGFGNVTHIEMTNLHGLKDVNATGTYPFRIYDVTYGYIGNGTVSWIWSGLASWGATGSITVDITDFNRKTYTGYKVFRLDGVPCGGNWYAYHSNTNFPSSIYYNGSYAAGIFGPNNYVANATYKIYGGAYVSPVIFSISDSSNSSTKLQNVAITISNGQSGVTDVNGEWSVEPIPSGSGYTYSLIKTGYASKLNQSLGSYGMTGGTLNLTMDNMTAAPTADFSTNRTGGKIPLAVAFTDLSTGYNISAWSWNFCTGSSTAQNPTYTFPSVVNCLVNLSVTNSIGTSYKSAYVNSTSYTLGFVANTTSGTAPATIQFNGSWT